jgi:hypothetical protein
VNLERVYIYKTVKFSVHVSGKRLNLERERGTSFGFEIQKRQERDQIHACPNAKAILAKMEKRKRKKAKAIYIQTLYSLHMVGDVPAKHKPHINFQPALYIYLNRAATPLSPRS